MRVLLCPDQLTEFFWNGRQVGCLPRKGIRPLDRVTPSLVPYNFVFNTHLGPLIFLKPQNLRNEIHPKAYPEEMEVIRTLFSNTSFGTLFPFARGFSPAGTFTGKRWRSSGHSLVGNILIFGYAIVWRDVVGGVGGEQEGEIVTVRACCGC